MPPESPRYITVPEPPQSSEPKLPPIKGYLPVPRDQFPKREGNRKVKPGYVEAATQLSKAELAGEPPKSEEEARHRVLAAARRSAFSTGIQGLYSRKAQREQKLTARSEYKRRVNKEAATAPERLDDLLTRPTVRAATALKTTVAPDPNRFAKAEAARLQHQQRLDLKAEARRDSLAQLYVAAQDFILDEAELEKRIETIFTNDYHKHNSTDQGKSIWDSNGPPISVAALKAEATGQSSRTMEKKAPAIKTTLRQKAVAEELTGGKL